MYGSDTLPEKRTLSWKVFHWPSRKTSLLLLLVSQAVVRVPLSPWWCDSMIQTSAKFFSMVLTSKNTIFRISEKQFHSSCRSQVSLTTPSKKTSCTESLTRQTLKLLMLQKSLIVLNSLMREDLSQLMNLMLDFWKKFKQEKILMWESGVKKSTTSKLKFLVSW